MENNNIDDSYITHTEFKKTLSFVVILVLVFAIALGGVFGFILSSLVGTSSGANQSVSGPIQNLPVVNEQSAVINVVKKSNPAVVSIVISQYVPNTSSNSSLNNYLCSFFGTCSNPSSGNNGTGYSKQEVGAGSGFIISSDGYILTNKHVVANPQDSYTVIMNNGKTYNAKIVGVDPTNDIAVVKINATNLPTLTLGNSSNLQLGESVVAIGNALGQYQNTVDTGVVSGLDRNVQAQDPVTHAIEQLTGVIQTDAEINPGNSGGPLLNLKGQVIGINTAVASSAHGIGFAIPINQAKADVNSVISQGKLVKPELGVSYVNVTAGIQRQYHLKYDYGALIMGSSNQSAVIPNTPASRAGLKKGDVILEVNGTKVDSANPLSYLIGEQKVNSTITLQVYTKSGSLKNISVLLNKTFK
ncbi:trypsin-like peptidase domain-containing protein [Patescibacteria group bacterium]|nr:trypsin-like peptidase domain-containing protein [Patescibacteria group bacterium]